MQVPTKEDELLSVYHVTVKTSDIFGAGTDCDVLLTMFGEKDGKVRVLSGVQARSQNCFIIAA